MGYGANIDTNLTDLLSGKVCTLHFDPISTITGFNSDLEYTNLCRNTPCSVSFQVTFKV